MLLDPTPSESFAASLAVCVVHLTGFCGGWHTHRLCVGCCLGQYICYYMYIQSCVL